MLKPVDITGVVLAGGRSSRFGSNKAMANFDGKSFLEHSIELLTPFCKEVIISGKKELYEHTGLTVWEDIYPNIGPLGGIYTALNYSATSSVLIVSCDMPFITSDILAKMINSDSDYSVLGWFSEGNGGQFPLLLSKTILNEVKQLIDEKQYRMKQLFHLERSHQLEIPDKWKPYFININTVREYKNILS